MVFVPFPKLSDAEERHHRPLMSTQTSCRSPATMDKGRPGPAQALQLPTCSAPTQPRAPLIPQDIGLPPSVCSSLGLPKPSSPPCGFPVVSHPIQSSTTLVSRVPTLEPRRPNNSLQMGTGQGIVITFNILSVFRDLLLGHVFYGHLLS